MRWRSTAYLVASLVALFFAALFLFAFVLKVFQFAWACALIVVLANETRVQIGERLPRTILFWVHLSCAIPFFLALTILAFALHATWLVVLTALLGCAALSTGGVLWYRGLRERIKLDGRLF